MRCWPRSCAAARPAYRVARWRHATRASRLRYLRHATSLPPHGLRLQPAQRPHRLCSARHRQTRRLHLGWPPWPRCPRPPRRTESLWRPYRCDRPHPRRQVPSPHQRPGVALQHLHSGRRHHQAGRRDGVLAFLVHLGEAREEARRVPSQVGTATVATTLRILGCGAQRFFFLWRPQHCRRHYRLPLLSRMFMKDESNIVEEVKLKVVYVMFKQSPRAASFDVLPFHKSNDSLASRKEPEDLASQSKSNAKSEDGELSDGIAYTLHQRVLELEDELNTATREKLQSSQEEINNLKNSLDLKISLEVLSEEHSSLLGQNKNPEAEIANLNEGLASDKQQFEEKLSQRDAEIVNCKQEFSAASEKLLQEKSTNSTVTVELQETIESIRVKLEQVSDKKLLVETKFKQPEEETCGSKKYNQELSNTTEGLSEEKFRHEAKILTLHQAIENLESKLESILEIWLAFCDYKHIYGHDYNRDRFGVRGKLPPLFILYGMNTCSGDYSKPASFEEMEKFDVDSSTLHPILPECCVIKSNMEIARIQYANGGALKL